VVVVVLQVTCNGQHVLSTWSCISDGILCSGMGTCTDGQCNCSTGREGTYCQTDSTVASSSDNTLAITLVTCTHARTHDTRTTRAYSCHVAVLCAQGIALPLAFFCAAGIAGMLVAAVLFLAQRVKNRRQEWDIDWNDLEVGEELGMGGHGEVFRAKWRGTEVAVKMLASNVPVTRDMQRCFSEEVRVLPHRRDAMIAGATAPVLASDPN
jgi:hypothetical protein